MLVLVVGGIRHSEETFPVLKTILRQTNFKLQSLDSVGIFFFSADPDHARTWNSFFETDVTLLGSVEPSQK